ncbi:cell division protein ZipA [Aliiglaciecola sp. CAU 1673]|uniref:cell division protein ZipA n=1 Tax=Aliiglaciecola sp. CAU 1673 TaxID=3032595 RepID=UPI0023DBCC51|nr:cell division protein ZipA [Aliiglaciecola sp. CAU 1673]MDF2177232.1 cell division protein ZipA [Aliiglaciecola sp. CAU 1673]
MEELRLTFLIFGALAIAGILAHGLWTVRKNRNKQSQERPAPANLQHRQANWDEQDSDFELPDDEPTLSSSSKQDDFDDLGIGKVRVIRGEAPAKPAAPAQPRMTPIVRDEPRPPVREEAPVIVTAKEHKETQLQDPNIPEPPAFLLRRDAPATVRAKVTEPAPQVKEPEPEPEAKPQPKEENMGLSGLAAQAKNLVKRKKAEPVKRKEPALRKEPTVKEDQMHMDFEEAHEVGEPEEDRVDSTVKTPNQEVLVLNVKAPDYKPIPGASLLPALLTLGFKFGDQDIFHRHVNSNGKGPVLFSLANMFKPGVFDIDNMETFSTQGLSLFMILPIEGDPHQVFNMMHNAARKLADEFDAQVLDGRRSVLTKQSLQQYVEKIREFERRRMIKKAN